MKRSKTEADGVAEAAEVQAVAEVSETAAAAPAAPERRAHEAWAEELGHLPRSLALGSLVPGISPRVDNPKFGAYAAARALCGWEMGQEVTRAEFEKAIVDQATGAHH